MSLPIVCKDSMWLDMFYLSCSSWAEKALRAVIVYLFLVLALRYFGKRELAQVNPFDLVVLLMLSNTVQNAIIGADNSVTGGVIGALTLMVANHFLVRFAFKRRRLDNLLGGKPTTLIADGRIREDALAGERLTKSELLLVVNRQGYTSLEEIDRCDIEPGGSFFIKGKAQRLAELRHAELMARLEHLDLQIAELRRQMQKN